MLGRAGVVVRALGAEGAVLGAAPGLALVMEQVNCARPKAFLMVLAAQSRALVCSSPSRARSSALGLGQARSGEDGLGEHCDEMMHGFSCGRAIRAGLGRCQTGAECEFSAMIGKAL